ncbi:Ltp family lipoprotein [Gordonia malaquae]|uniref:Ltp family lipoprotein n=1 Tax=Gordonia malaquae TaxID=410332 RepID=UPI00301AD785
MNVRFAAVLGVASVMILVAGCGSGDDTSAAPPSVSTVTATVTETETETSTVAVSPTTTADKTPQATRTTEPVDETTTARGGLTTSQSNAVGKACEYLDISAFSRQGLIDQLEYEGFSTSDAAYAVDYVSPNWTTQAKKKAAEYMGISPFSQQGLIDQLVYEGFTQAQAEAGAASQF